MERQLPSHASAGHPTEQPAAVRSVSPVEIGRRSRHRKRRRHAHKRPFWQDKRTLAAVLRNVVVGTVALALIFAVLYMLLSPRPTGD